MPISIKPVIAVLLTVAAGVLAPVASASNVPSPRLDPDAREVLYVGNNWDGTADVVDPVSFQRLARVNIIPDKEERMAEIQSDPAAFAIFLAIREQVGEGHDQFVDDMFSSPDGRFLYVSRPSFADVVGIDLETRKIAWRIRVEGNRADHMAISPDGTRLLVSASTAGKVHIIDPRIGKPVGEFPSGDQPHENNFSADGKRIYHASIGSVFTPLDQPELDATKGKRFFEVVDAGSMQVTKRVIVGPKLAEAGHPGMSSAVRPMAIAPDEKQVYFQVSFFHGFVEYDLVQDKVLRLAHLPVAEKTKSIPREQYLLDSAHHGLAMNPEGTKLCAAGTMSDYAAIVDRQTFAYKIAAQGSKPYWSTNSGDGKHCFISFSGDDAIAAVRYSDGAEVARLAVGDHPQRMRVGGVHVGLLGIGPSPTEPGPRLVVRVSQKRVRARRPVRIRVRVLVQRDGRTVPVRGAKVRLAGVTATTDRKGWATLRKRRGFERVRAYRIRATHPDYTAGTGSLRTTRRR